MNCSKQRHDGGAYRRYKTMVAAHAKPGHTYAVPARDVLEWVERAAAGGRKSVPEKFCIDHGTPVAACQMRVNWRYDVAGMMEKLGGGDYARDGGL